MISVIIPTYNVVLLIERAIRSVLAQTNQDFEILIVDDGSTDNTVEMVSNIPDPRLRIFRQAVNQGPAAARNRGMREAKGEYLAYLDGDDYWEPEFLQETASFLDEHPECVAVSVRQKHRIIGKPERLSPAENFSETPMVIGDFYLFWTKYHHVCTGSALVRKSAAWTVGGMREDLRYAEDLEFWNLLATQGQWGMIAKVLFTSDGGAVTRKQGWLAKNRKRWASAPEPAEWSRRIRKKLPAGQKASFAEAEAAIAKNLTYAMIQSGRDNAARKAVKTYGRFWPKKLFYRLLQTATINTASWKTACIILRLRERLRII